MYNFCCLDIRWESPIENFLGVVHPACLRNALRHS
jgi:hypothetical protein